MKEDPSRLHYGARVTVDARLVRKRRLGTLTRDEGPLREAGVHPSGFGRRTEAYGRR